MLAITQSRRRINTQRRHEKIRAKVNELSKIRIEGMKPDYDDVIRKVAELFCLSERTVQNIMNGRV